MAEKYQVFDLIQEITRLDGSRYFELGNVMMNGRAEKAAMKGFIKRVRIVQLNIAHSTAVTTYEKYINEHYEFPPADLTSWEEWTSRRAQFVTLIMRSSSKITSVN